MSCSAPWGWETDIHRNMEGRVDGGFRATYLFEPRRDAREPDRLEATNLSRCFRWVMPARMLAPAGGGGARLGRAENKGRGRVAEDPGWAKFRMHLRPEGSASESPWSHWKETRLDRGCSDRAFAEGGACARRGREERRKVAGARRRVADRKERSVTRRLNGKISQGRQRLASLNELAALPLGQEETERKWELYGLSRDSQGENENGQ